MSENENEDSLEELAKKKLKKELNEGNDETLEGIKAERDNLREQLSAIALKSFEEEVVKVAEKLSKGDKIKKQEIIEKIGDDTEMLRTFQAKAITENEDDDGTEKVPPAGIVSAYKPEKKTTESIEDLYNILDSRTTTREEKEIANKKLDKMWAKQLLENKKSVRKVLRGDED